MPPLQGFGPHCAGRMGCGLGSPVFCQPGPIDGLSLQPLLWLSKQLCDLAQGLALLARLSGFAIKMVLNGFARRLLKIKYEIAFMKHAAPGLAHSRFSVTESQ